MTDVDLSNYNEVADRIVEFREKHPAGFFQTRFVDVPPPFNERFIAVEASIYRKPGDEPTGVDMAWEPVPGKTPYTKDSELMNASTSAVGRALVYALAADAKKGIASADEVRNRQGSGEVKTLRPSEKQLEFFKSLVEEAGAPDDAVEDILAYARSELTGGKNGSMSKAIEGLKDNETQLDVAKRLEVAAQKLKERQSAEHAEAEEARAAEKDATDD
jgi:hypothetical protein